MPLRVIREEKFDLVVLDVNMPGMDGYEVLSTIRAEELPTQVILLTARQQERDVLHGFQLGGRRLSCQAVQPAGTDCPHQETIEPGPQSGGVRGAVARRTLAEASIVELAA